YSSKSAPRFRWLPGPTGFACAAVASGPSVPCRRASRSRGSAEEENVAPGKVEAGEPCQNLNGRLALQAWLTAAKAGRSRLHLPEVADQDHVARLIALRQQQALAVARPGKIEKQARGEFSELLRRAAGQRLLPDVGGSISG